MSTINQLSTSPTKPIRMTSRNSMTNEEGDLWHWAQERRKIFFLPSEERIKPIRNKIFSVNRILTKKSFVKF